MAAIDPRTVRAVVVADAGVAAFVTLLGVFAGFPFGPSLVVGAVVGTVVSLPILLVSVRAARLGAAPPATPPAAPPNRTDEDDRG